MYHEIRVALAADSAHPQIIGNELGIGYCLCISVEGEAGDFALRST